METCGYAWFSGTAWPGRSFLDPDELRLALLSLLAEPPETPMHGYELMKRLEDHSGGVYRARAGTVYPILQQLEDESLIVSELREGKKVYVLTEEGKRELAQKCEAVQRIWRRSRRWEDWGGAFAKLNGWSSRRFAPWRERVAPNRRSSGCAKFCGARYANLKN
jgi:DNA-binding PadR family transcriptional regulator